MATLKLVLVGWVIQLQPLLHIAFYDHISFLDLHTLYRDFDILLHLAAGVGSVFLRDVGNA